METFDFTSPAYYTSGLQAVIAGGVYARPTLAAVIAALLGTIDPKAQLVGILLVISVVAFGHLISYAERSASSCTPSACVRRTPQVKNDNVFG